MQPINNEVLFSSTAGGHHIRVQVLLNADEFIFLRNLTYSRGISASSFFRQFLNEERKRIAQESFSAAAPKFDTAENAQDLHNHLKLLCNLIKEIYKR